MLLLILVESNFLKIIKCKKIDKNDLNPTFMLKLKIQNNWRELLLIASKINIKNNH